MRRFDRGTRRRRRSRAARTRARSCCGRPRRSCASGRTGATNARRPPRSCSPRFPTASRGSERLRNAPSGILCRMITKQNVSIAGDELRTRFRGALLRPGEEGYDEARCVWNGAIDRHPALIARCAGADDVAEAVRFARERDLLISVQGAGPALVAHAACYGALMIDLSLMKAVRVDRSKSTRLNSSHV